MGPSAAESPTRPDPTPAGAVRASDAERDEVVGKLKEEFAAGRLSHDTFMYRMAAVLKSRHTGDLPPLVADLPAGPVGPAARRPGWARALGGVRDAWHRARPGVTALGGAMSSVAINHPVRRLTGAMRRADAAASPPLPLEFPRGGANIFSIGRHGSCDLTIPDMSVSRVHARLERTPDGWLLTDLSSTNGTRVNGWRVRGEVRVRAGDLVSFGDVVYLLAAADGA